MLQKFNFIFKLPKLRPSIADWYIHVMDINWKQDKINRLLFYWKQMQIILLRTLLLVRHSL